MNINIRKIKFEDKVEVISMMKTFYSSEAVFTNGSDAIFDADFKACINNSPYLEGYVFASDEIILGYAMLAKSFSTEFGKSCIWFEDLYLKPEYRGQRIIPQFIRYVETVYKDSIFRLEVEKENAHACHVYEKQNFIELPYCEMVKY